MTDENEKSKRQRRKAAREGARKLRNDPAWAAVAKDPAQKLRELDQELRGARVYGESDECPACVKAREAAGDETALCDEHLAEAMGF